VKNAVEVGGATRDGIHEALPKLKDVPSVVYGKITFNAETRRAQNPTFEDLIIKDGAFVPLEASEATPEATP